ncbi:MAG: MnmC family methyltransferase, partial [Verrucomicrobiia bacterium]
IRSVADGETFHPNIGPIGEARALYVEQLNIIERIATSEKEFVIWDVGLGAAANPISILERSRHLLVPMRIVSFDKTTEPLEFALLHTKQLQYLNGWEPVLHTLIERGKVSFANGKQPVIWEFYLGDFPSILNDFINRRAIKSPPPPGAILYDAYSPKANPRMWSLELFKNLYALLDQSVPCSLATYSRSTLIRVTLLLAGFFVGVGNPAGEKEETTIAANRAELIPKLLDKRWLFRARRSTSAHPLLSDLYIQKPLSSEMYEQLLAHPQFANQPI